MIVPCDCGAKLKIDDDKIGPQGVKVRCPRCGNVLEVQKKSPPPAAVNESPSVFSGSARGADVLVAHDSKVVRDTIVSVLADAGFGTDIAADGAEALKKAVENKPKAIVLDVGLPGIYGFEVCERLKGNRETSDIKIILLSSVYDMRRYKRTPVSLYGADDYIEKHHIQDYLPLKLRKLLHPEQFLETPQQPDDEKENDLPEMARPPAREFKPSLLPERLAHEELRTPQTVAEKLNQQESQGSSVLPESFSLDGSIFQKEECYIPKFEAADPAALEKARRFARIIVSDIALYNQEAVAEGLRNGTFYDLLKTDINEGRELFEKRVPKAIRCQKDYYQEAFDNFIKAQDKQAKNVR